MFVLPVDIFTIELPPLRERESDIPLLIQHYISFFAAKTNKKINGVTKEAEDLLKQSYWKGTFGN